MIRKQKIHLSTSKPPAPVPLSVKNKKKIKEDGLTVKTKSKKSVLPKKQNLSEKTTSQTTSKNKILPGEKDPLSKNADLLAKKSPTKKTTLIKNLEFLLSEHLKGRHFRPGSSEELAKRLTVLPEYRDLFEKILLRFENEGKVKKSSNGIWSSLKEPRNEKVASKVGACFAYSKSLKLEIGDYVEGVISFHPRGFAFVRVESSSNDVFIPASLTLNALPGDTVGLEITDIDRKGPTGRVVQILKRGRNSLVGIALESSNKADPVITILVQALSQHTVKLLCPGNETIKIGDRLLVKVDEWENQRHEVKCSLVENLGSIEDSSQDTAIAIAEFGLRSEFPADVLDEALSHGPEVSSEEINKRRDLRNMLSITIDPDTAKDFDDAISIEKTAGGYFLAVHIADVAHYVKHGTLLDHEARARCNSTYFPGYCLPMLPSELSDELCSLKPGVNRLCVSILMQMDEEANLTSYEIVRSCIKSSRRLTYKQALAILQKRLDSDLLATIECMQDLCYKLKKQKATRGSVELSLPEAVVLCDQKGMPTGLDLVEYDITHQMIEEFMVKANEVVATHLSKLKIACIYRVHEAPALEDLKDFFQAAKFYGHVFHEIPTPEQWYDFFQKIANESYANHLASVYIRSMRMAQYSTKNIGHYGLGLTHYCHFTSPIRRYSDLTVIRALFDEPRDSDEELEAMALKCCDCERNSAKTEGSVLFLKKLRYLKIEQEHDDKESSYEAVVTKCKPFGLTFDLKKLLFEGFIHISALADDYFVFDEIRSTLRGRETGIILESGKHLQVSLERVDLIYRECKWTLDPVFVHQTYKETQRRRALRLENQENFGQESASLNAFQKWKLDRSKEIKNTKFSNFQNSSKNSTQKGSEKKQPREKKRPCSKRKGKK